MAQSLTSLDDVLAALNNWFPIGVVRGRFTVSDGSIEVDGLQYGQYFRIVNSVFNKWKMPKKGWLMSNAPPRVWRWNRLS